MVKLRCSLNIGIHARGGSASSTARTSIWSHPRPWTFWTSFYDMITKSDSRPVKPWNTLTSVNTRRHDDGAPDPL